MEAVNRVLKFFLAVLVGGIVAFVSFMLILFAVDKMNVNYSWQPILLLSISLVFGVFGSRFVIKLNL